MPMVEVSEGGGPLVFSIPHSGTGLPDEVAERLNETGRALTDTDWWVDRLYDFAGAFDATTVKANLSRYVIDLNRDPGGKSLYPGQATTGLCPTQNFDGKAIYASGAEPDAREIERRKAAYFDPYHEALESALRRTRESHGFALLYDCHSIRSQVPRLFEGTLPTLNLGTNDGASCAGAVESALRKVCEGQSAFSFITNGRFKGGWITRHYGRPQDSIHAVQMELAQSAYMEEAPPWTFDEEKAGRLRRILRELITALIGLPREELEARR